jgi:hypothetical protein
MLTEMGWRVAPSVLPLALLPQSDRRIPPWVLSTVVLLRIEALLAQLERRFEMREEHRTAPKGRVNWQNYAAQSIPRAAFLSIPCRYPDLLDDRRLRAAIRFTLERQYRSLEGQRTMGVFVLRLMEFCQALLRRVGDVIARRPSPEELDSWLRGCTVSWGASARESKRSNGRVMNVGSQD